MSLRYAILGVLDGRAMTGYELGSYFEASANWVWSAKLSQIYPQLNAMAAEGVIASEDVTQGRRPATRYTITTAGRDDLHRWLTTSHAIPSVRDGFLLQSLFLELLGPETVDLVLRDFIDQHRARIASWEEHQRQLLAGETQLIRERLQARPENEHERMRLMKAMVFAGLIRQSEAAIGWARDMQLVNQVSTGSLTP